MSREQIVAGFVKLFDVEKKTDGWKTECLQGVSEKKS